MFQYQKAFVRMVGTSFRDKEYGKKHREIREIYKQAL
jgi:hypothetical protein